MRLLRHRASLRPQCGFRRKAWLHGGGSHDETILIHGQSFREERRHPVKADLPFAPLGRRQHCPFGPSLADKLQPDGQPVGSQPARETDRRQSDIAPWCVKARVAGCLAGGSSCRRRGGQQGVVASDQQLNVAP